MYRRRTTSSGTAGIGTGPGGSEPAHFPPARQEESRLKSKGTPLKAGEEMPTMVVIRADRTTPFRVLNEIIKACQKHNYRKFALKAMNRREGS